MSPARALGIRARRRFNWTSGAFLTHDGSQVAGFGTFRNKPLAAVAVFTSRAVAADIANPWYLANAYVPTSFTGDIVIGLPMATDGQTVSQDLSSQMSTLATGLQARSNRYLIRLGWEMNLGSWAWKVTDANLTTWKSRWATYYGILKGTLGSQALIGLNWNGDANQGGYTGTMATLCSGLTPDWVGCDLYDEYEGMTDSSSVAYMLGRANSFNTTATVARSLGLKMAVPEWGVSLGTGGTQWAGHTGGDNPLFIDSMVDAYLANADIMLHESYFNEPDPYLLGDIYRPSGSVSNPTAAARYAARYAAL